MKSRSLNRLTLLLWIILLFSGAVLFVLVFLSAETQFLDSAGRDEWMSTIKAATEIDRLRNIATNMVSMSSITGGTAIWLCRLAIGAFLVIICCSVTGLFQARKMKRHLTTPSNKSTQASATSPFGSTIL